MSSRNSKYSSYLTRLAHGCTPFITAFLVIHLASPIAAGIGGSSASSGVMVGELAMRMALVTYATVKLLGREYYQTALGEPLLIITPIALHMGAGVAKRLLSGKQPQARPLTRILTWTGYTLGFFFLPIHYITHRIYPTVKDYPIDAIGPAELDYEFVKYGLQRWPARSWALYAGLVGCVALHGVAGLKVIWQTWAGPAGNTGATKRKAGSVNKVAAASGIVAPVLLGIFALSREPPMIFPSTVARFDTVFQRSWIYRI